MYRLAHGGGGRRGNVLHHVNSEGNYPGVGNVRGGACPGNMSRGNVQIPLAKMCVEPWISKY